MEWAHGTKRRSERRRLAKIRPDLAPTCPKEIRRSKKMKKKKSTIRKIKKKQATRKLAQALAAVLDAFGFCGIGEADSEPEPSLFPEIVPEPARDEPREA